MLEDLCSRIYVINLAERRDRRREMDRELRRLGLSLSHPKVRLFAATRPNDRAGFPSVGARGCFLSHLAVLRDAQDGARGPIAVLEDDVAFTDSLLKGKREFGRLLRETSWDIFYGGHEGINLSEEGIPLIPSNAEVRTAHFVCFTPAVVGALVTYLDAMARRPPGDPAGGPMHVDGAYSWFRRDHPELKTRAAVPVLAVQRSSRSDIADLAWFDRIPGIREAAQVARVIRRNASRRE